VDAEQLRFALTLAGLHSACCLLAYGVFGFMARRGIARARQVGASHVPNAQLTRGALFEALGQQLLFFLLCAFIVFPLWQPRAGGAATAWHGFGVMLLHLIAFALIQDTIFYFSHRALHTRWLFKHIHAKHHRFRFVRPLVAEYAHPVENLLNFAAFFAGPILLGTPFLTLQIWIVIRMFETLEAHSGFTLTPLSDRHSFHHLYATKGIYGSFVSPWDFLLGTDREWRKARREQARSSANSPAADTSASTAARAAEPNSQ
jgi:sterol desaturase/sphingolipid hydroxylase (fatty acid hydroxylase superfamily)